MPERLFELEEWVGQQEGISEFSLAPASDDASFRRYFRVTALNKTYIAMDAPPDKEDCHPFVAIAEAFGEQGINVPKVYAKDFSKGFLLLSDLGSQQYLDELNSNTVDRLYADALNALLTIQASGPREGIPLYDHELLIKEMELFREWLLQKHLGIELTVDENTQLNDVFAGLAKSALEQPQVCVHRDYHSRNLMVLDSHNPGILDFQDAVLGPVTYDLVSLLRDCYIEWPSQQVEDWAMGYFSLAVQSGVLSEEDESLFLKWFDLMGVQRHLKASGIFARLNIRDGKPGYLRDIPRTLGYIEKVSFKYPDLRFLDDLLKERVLPNL